MHRRVEAVELVSGAPLQRSVYVVSLISEMDFEFDPIKTASNERRLKLVGLIDGIIFTVVYTMRGEVIRLISARRSNRAEEKVYGDRALHL